MNLVEGRLTFGRYANTLFFFNFLIFLRKKLKNNFEMANLMGALVVPY